MARHKRICGDLFKPTIDRAADAYAKIRAKGFDPCSKQTLLKYYEDNDDLYRSVNSIGKFDPSIGMYLLTGYSFSEALLCFVLLQIPESFVTVQIF